jgi:hypothetical protein
MQVVDHGSSSSIHCGWHGGRSQCCSFATADYVLYFLLLVAIAALLQALEGTLRVLLSLLP